MKQLRTLKFNLKKDTFVTLFLILTVFLLFLPLTSTFNELLTSFVIHLRGYVFIRDVIVPFEVRVIAVILHVMGFTVSVTKEYVVLGNTASQADTFIAEIVWNCIGWQSLLFFVISAAVGLQGEKYTLSSKFKALVIGLIGTFFVNIFRIVAVVLSGYYLGQGTAIVVHDYGSLLMVVAWLFLFWWFVYQFVLEEKVSVSE